MCSMILTPHKDVNMESRSVAVKCMKVRIGYPTRKGVPEGGASRPIGSTMQGVKQRRIGVWHRATGVARRLPGPCGNAIVVTATHT